MMTADQARAMLADIAKNKPDRWHAAMQTLAVDAIESLERHEAQVNLLTDRVMKLNTALVRLIEGLKGAPDTAEPDPEAVAGEPPVPPAAPPTNGVADQMNVEAQMDAAVAAEAAEKRNGGSRPAGRPSQRRPAPAPRAPAPPPAGRPAAPPAPQPGTVRMGSDGTPLTPEQAAAEAAMDEAIAAQEAEKRG